MLRYVIGQRTRRPMKIVNFMAASERAIERPREASSKPTQTNDLLCGNRHQIHPAPSFVILSPLHFSDRNLHRSQLASECDDEVQSSGNLPASQTIN